MFLLSQSKSIHANITHTHTKKKKLYRYIRSILRINIPHFLRIFSTISSSIFPQNLGISQAWKALEAARPRVSPVSPCRESHSAKTKEASQSATPGGHGKIHGKIHGKMVGIS
jgi:hypothetical protein